MNSLAPATCDGGCATPPPGPGFPPKYTPEIFEEVIYTTKCIHLSLITPLHWVLDEQQVTNVQGSTFRKKPCLQLAAKFSDLFASKSISQVKSVES